MHLGLGMYLLVLVCPSIYLSETLYIVVYICTLPWLYASVHHHFISLFHLHVVHAVHVLCVFLWMQWTVLHSTAYRSPML